MTRQDRDAVLRHLSALRLKLDGEVAALRRRVDEIERDELDEEIEVGALETAEKEILSERADRLQAIIDKSRREV